MKATREAITFKIKPDFKKHIEKQAKGKHLSTGSFIKAVLKKHTKYVEPDLV